MSKDIEAKDLAPEEISDITVAMKGGEYFVKVDDCILEENEETRIVISITKNGDILIRTKSDDENLSIAHIVGYLETSKFDVLAQGNGSASPSPEFSPEDQVPTELVLTEEDFDNVPELAQMGHNVGGKLTLPKIAVDKILEARKK